MFGLFKRAPKRLKGRITAEKSGIYIDLPSGWHAYEISNTPSNTFLIGDDKEKGTLIFNVTDYIFGDPGGLFLHPFTDEPVDAEITTEGDFKTFAYPLDDEKYLQSWETDTEKYHIRFIYMYEKEYYDFEIKYIQQILNSLVKYPAGL